ncbi:MAG: 4-hydroxy-tetrahydrodipicolinate synthase [Magnetococcales bacterium]|nr:4-hydroxy-tetrahydrodipicolinate synthase [Magnetococcales bacterium]
MFAGVFTALITPFHNGNVDLDALERLIEFGIAGGIDGLVPCGTTGESATLSHEEHQLVIRRTVEIVNRRVKVIAGTGSNATSESIELTRFAQQAGADGALLITPYYNKPTQEGLFQHYKAVAEHTALPLVLYNVPTRTGVDLEPQTVARLAVMPNIVSIKEATGKMERASLIRALCDDRITLLSGDDGTFLPFLAVGGRGVISVTTNILPGRMVDLWKSWNDGDAIAALAAHDSLEEINRLLFCETNPIPVKAAAHMMGMCGPEHRLPLTPLGDKNRPALRAALETLGLALPNPSLGADGSDPAFPS